MKIARTEKQIEASRRNGARSRGPATVAGKQKSTRNSCRHGLYAKNLAPAPGSPEESALIAVVSALESDLEPRNPAESQAIQIAAICLWSLRRIQHYEKTVFQTEMEAQRKLYPDETFISLYERAFRSLADKTNELVALERLENRHHRNFLRAIVHFHRLRAVPELAEPTEKEKSEKRGTNPAAGSKSKSPWPVSKDLLTIEAAKPGNEPGPTQAGSSEPGGSEPCHLNPHPVDSNRPAPPLHLNRHQPPLQKWLRRRHHPRVGSVGGVTGAIIVRQFAYQTGSLRRHAQPPQVLQRRNLTRGQPVPQGTGWQ
jgi:hypothetical protein